MRPLTESQISRRAFAASIGLASAWAAESGSDLGVQPLAPHGFYFASPKANPETALRAAAFIRMQFDR